MVQWEKILSATQETQETWVHSLGQEDPLEKEMNPLQYFLPEKSPRQRSLVGYHPKGQKELDRTEQLSTCYKVVVRMLHSRLDPDFKDKVFNHLMLIVI